MQNMNRLYRTFDLGSRHFIYFFSFLGVFLFIIFPSKNIRRWCDGEREEERGERREGREGNVIPPLSPLSPHTAMVMVRDVHITLQLGRYI